MILPLAGQKTAGQSVQYASAAALRRYLLLYALAVLSIAAIWGGVGAIIVPLHVQQIETANYFSGVDAGVNLQLLSELKARVAAGLAVPTPEQRRLLGLLADFDAARAANLSIIASVSVFMTMLVQPVVGVLSDRTRSSWGRRAPWIFCGAILTTLSLAATYSSTSILAIVIAFSIIGIGTNAASSPLTATLADRVPREKVGAASAFSGLGLMLGLVLGTAAAGAHYGAIGVAAYLPFGAVALLFCLLFVFGARDRTPAHLVLAPVTMLGYLRSFTLALRDHDFRWVWVAKLLIMFGYAVSHALSIYMLQSYVQPALSSVEAARIAPLLLLAALPGTLISMAISGRWSDRIGRRKPFVIGSSLLYALAMSVPLLWPTLPAMFVQAALGGLALGCFLIVDQALVIDVLPDRDAAGRDLGISNFGGNLGQALGPIVAGLIVATTGSYRMVWAAGVVLVIIAAIAILPVRRVR